MSNVPLSNRFSPLTKLITSVLIPVHDQSGLMHKLDYFSETSVLRQKDGNIHPRMRTPSHTRMRVHLIATEPVPKPHSADLIRKDAPKVSGYSLLIGLARQKKKNHFFSKNPPSAAMHFAMR